jgi:hypothetical protein
MKFYEIVYGMHTGEYTCGDWFESEAGIMFINFNGRLVWQDRDETTVECVIGDDLNYELI